jgi:hypothetical protein
MAPGLAPVIKAVMVSPNWYVAEQNNHKIKKQPKYIYSWDTV